MTLRRCSLLLLSLAFTLLVGAGTAQAHNELVSTVPADASTVSAPPSEVSLTFDANIAPEFLQVAVLDGQDRAVQAGDPTVNGPNVTQALEPTEAGSYRVSYRVVSADGHPIAGTTSFIVADAVPAAIPVASQMATATMEPQPAPAVALAPTQPPLDDPHTAAASIDTGTDWAPVAVYAALLATLGAAAAASYFTVRLRQRTSQEQEERTPAYPET